LALAFAEAARGQSIVYSNTVGTGVSANGWCVSGATNPNCGPQILREIAAPFSPSLTSILSSIDLALSYNSGTSGAVITLNSDAGGVPGGVLESWPISPTPSTVVASGSLTLQAGQTYWVVAQPLAGDTLDFWRTNNAGLGGGLYSNGSGWFPLSTSNYGTQTLPAFTVWGNSSSPPTTVAVTVTTNPPGLQMVVDGATFISPHTFAWVANDVHSIGVPSPQGSGGVPSVFTAWSDGGAQTHNITVPPTAATYTANFKTQYLLSTLVSPTGAGTVTANPPGAGGLYDSGASVQLTATPNSNFQFSGWSGALSGAANPQSLIMNGPESVTANFTALACAYGASPNSASLPAAASNGNTLTVTPTSSCGSWSAASPVNWIVITGGGGTGAGTVTYNVLANPNSGPRSATLTIAGQPLFTVTQAGQGCLLSLNPASASVGVNGGNFSLSVNLSGADCAWSVANTSSWAPITAASSGTGSGSVSYQVLSNQSSSVSRTGAITITTAAGAQASFGITQAGNTCNFSLPQSSAAFLSGGGSGTATVIATPGCAWTAGNSGAPWVTITSGSGPGNGSVSFTVSSTTFARTGQLTIAGQTFVITQSAPGNNVSCTAAVAAPAQIALEGRTELLGDLVVTCTGLSSAVSAGVSLTLNTDVTNTLSGTNSIDALLVSGGISRNGQISGYNSILWPAVTIGPGNAAMTITKVRADASLYTAGGGPLTVTGQVSVNIAGPVPLTYTAQSASSGCPAAPANSLTMACALPTLVFNKGQTSSPVVAQSSAFVAQSSGGGVQTLIPAIFQEQAAGVFSAGAGGATATRLRAVLTNIPATATLYAFLNPQEGSSLAALVSADSNGLGGTPMVPNGPCTCAQLSVNNGTAVATWVVNFADPNAIMQYTFQLQVTTPGTVDLSAVQLVGSLAPVSTVAMPNSTAPIPRYRDFSVAQTLSHFQLSLTVGTATGVTSQVMMHPQATAADASNNGNLSGQATITSAAGGTPPPPGTNLQLNGTSNDQPCTFPNGGLVPPPDPGNSTSANFTCPQSSSGPNVIEIGITGGDPPADPDDTQASQTVPAVVSIELDAVPAGMGLQVFCDTNRPAPAPLTCVWYPGETHTIGLAGTTQALSTPGARGVFNNWSDNLPATHTITVPSSNTSYTATFTVQYLLNATPSPANGGTVTSDPPASDWYFNSGTLVNLTAKASAGFQFTGWTVDGSPNSSSTLQVAMNNTHTVTANFSPVSSTGVAVTVTSTPVGLTVSVNGSACTTPCNLSYAPGTQVPVSAASQPGAAGTNYVFASWSDAGAASHGITVPQAGGTYTAVFTTQYQLTTATAPLAGGSIVVNPLSATGYYNAGTQVQLTATPSPGFQFNNWSGYLSGSSVSQSITMNAPRTVTANFAGGPSGGGTLSVAGTQPAAGSGASGSFTFQFSDPAGAQSLSVVNVLINNFLDGRQACYLAYVVSSSTLVLVADNGVASGPYAGTVTLGNPNTAIQNSQCAVNLVSANLSGTTLSLGLNIAFKTGFGGNKVQYAAAGDLSGANTGWQAVGVWQAPWNPTGTIVVASGTPGRGAAPAGTAQQFTFTWTDTSANLNDLGVLNVLVNNFLDGRHACYLAFVPSAANAGSLYLVDDAGDAGGPFAGGMLLPASAGTIQNSQCMVSAAGSSATLASGAGGTTLTLTLNITFQSAFAGNRILYVAGRDAAGANNTDWQTMGTWMVQ